MKIAGIVLLIFLCIVVLYIFLLAVSALAVDAKREYRKDSGYYRFLLYLSTAVSMRIVRIHIHATGLEKIPAGGRFVLVSNHRSKFDPIVTWHVLRRYQLAFISKEENFHIPIFGRIIRKCCFMAIDREDPRKALTTINAAAELLKDDEVSIALYPEGTRSRDCKLLPFHNGVFKIAKKAGVPIVVMTVRGTEQVKTNYPWHRTDIYMDICGVISAEDVKAARTNEIGGLVRAMMGNV